MDEDMKHFIVLMAFFIIILPGTMTFSMYTLTLGQRVDVKIQIISVDEHTGFLITIPYTQIVGINSKYNVQGLNLGLLPNHSYHLVLMGIPWNLYAIVEIEDVI